MILLNIVWAVDKVYQASNEIFAHFILLKSQMERAWVPLNTCALRFNRVKMDSLVLENYIEGESILSKKWKISTCGMKSDKIQLPRYERL